MGVGRVVETLLTAAQCQLESESKTQPGREAGWASITGVSFLHFSIGGPQGKHLSIGLGLGNQGSEFPEDCGEAGKTDGGGSVYMWKWTEVRKKQISLQ